MKKFVPWVSAGVVLAAGVLTFANAGIAAEAVDSPSSLVEDYAYPGAAAVLAERGLKLHRGDGNIMLADCGADPNLPPADLILVQTNDLTLPKRNFCFRAVGATGYLSLEVPKVYFIRGDASHTVAAELEVQPIPGSGDAPTVDTVDVDPGEWQPVGEGADQGVAVLLELRY